MARHEVSSPAAKPWARDIERCPSRPQRSETRHQLYSSSSGPATAGWAKGGSSRSAGFSSDPIGSVLRHAQRSSTNVGLATTHHQVKNPPDSSSKPTPSFPPAKPVEKIDFSGPQHSVKNTPDSSSKPTPRFPPAKPVEKIDFSGPQHSVFPVSDPEPPPRVHKVHIIGEDEKAKFMAHALCDIYDSVELLGWRRHVPTKYRNISTGRRQTRQPTLLQRNTVPKRVYAPSDSSHIDLLVVTGPGVHAATALDSVKHRINEKSTVCLMSEGLGVLEDVRKKVFEDSDSLPNFFLGHMTHRLAWNRNTDSVKRLKKGETRLTPGISDEQVEANPRGSMYFTKAMNPEVTTWGSCFDLNSSVTAYDEWLQLKLPSMLFDSIVEPTCVMLELSYKDLMWNSAAQRLMDDLLRELRNVIRNMHELNGSPIMREFTESNHIARWIRKRILAKRDQPCQLVKRIEYGLPTDVYFRNGYFLRRATQLGIKIRVNSMMHDVVEAKHLKSLAKINSEVRLEETSIPSYLEEQYRPLYQDL